MSRSQEYLDVPGLFAYPPRTLPGNRRAVVVVVSISHRMPGSLLSPVVIVSTAPKQETSKCLTMLSTTYAHLTLVDILLIYAGTPNFILIIRHQWCY
jgi:hypothetical protein